MVSLVILSYNKRDLTAACLRTIFDHVPSKEAEVIVVDNASSDDSVSFIKKHFPQVKLIENSRNAGFAGGCNLGAKSAKGEYILFLNNDAKLSDDPLPALIDVFKKHPDTGIVGGLLVNHNGSLQRSYGAFYTVPNVVYLLFAGESGELQRFKGKEVTATDWVSGGFMMIRKDVFTKVKGFNESYFMYIEDMDLCYRVKKVGFAVYNTPHAKVEHLGQGSTNKTFAIVHIYEGLQIFYKQQRSILEYYIVKLLLFVKASIALLVGLLTFNKYLITTYFGALKTL
ncbi:MAG TPA: glycosyltransferase family 2 protein [Patescibacteria group bacterium]|nr:glycosyltransferase family 2 protein [Patescibacteria group bacterium]